LIPGGTNWQIGQTRASSFAFASDDRATHLLRILIAAGIQARVLSP
jgi:hypothetical protein